jgi:sporulation protein YlmC with PRC-barrel domain
MTWNNQTSFALVSILSNWRLTMKKIALIAASLAVLASPALAQTTGTAPAEAKFSTVAKDEMFSSKLKGLNVYNQKDEKVGEITDLAISKGEQIQAMILSVGGFLGVGEHYVAVSPASVRISYNKDKDTWSAKMNTTKEALKAAPEFKYPK